MFSEEDCRIFEYHDGAQKVFADPEEIYLGLARGFQGDVAGALERCASENELEAAEARALVYDVSRRVFQMQAFDRTTGKGATDLMCRAVLDDYLDWALEKKTEPGTSPSDSPLTEVGAFPHAAPTPAPSSACG